MNTVDQNDEDFGLVREEPSWTSVDLYYKGVHVKKSVPEKMGIEVLKETIDKYLESGFKPSWNEDTNKATQTTTPEDLGVCDKCGAKNLRSMKGKVYCSAKCWLPK